MSEDLRAELAKQTVTKVHRLLGFSLVSGVAFPEIRKVTSENVCDIQFDEVRLDFGDGVSVMIHVSQVKKS